MGDSIAIPGYDYGRQQVPRSAVTLEELRQLEQAAGFTEEDWLALQRAGASLADRAEEMVDAWRARIAAQPELARWFSGPDGKPDEDYKAAVKKRFVQWVRDVFTRPHDQAWLDYQEEIGRRHTPYRSTNADGELEPVQGWEADRPVGKKEIYRFNPAGRRKSPKLRKHEEMLIHSMSGNSDRIFRRAGGGTPVELPHRRKSNRRLPPDIIQGCPVA